jgi:hypothetical protein
VKRTIEKKEQARTRGGSKVVKERIVFSDFSDHAVEGLDELQIKV